MKRFFASCLSVGFASLLGVSNAQSLKELPFEGTPSAFFDSNGQASGCGLRLFGIEALVAPTRYRTVDISMLFAIEGIAKGVGMVKASSFEATPEALKAGRPTKVFRVTDGWLRVPGQQRTMVFEGRWLKSDESPDAVLYLTEFERLFAVLDTVLEGGDIQISVRRDGEQINPVYYGKVTIGKSDRGQLLGCLKEVLAAAEKATR